MRRFFDLLWLLAMTEFKQTYFGTVLGYVWSLIRPLMLFGVLLFVFTQVFKIGSDLPDYPVLLLLGIVLFTLFQEASQNAVTSVTTLPGHRPDSSTSAIVSSATRRCSSLV